MISLVLDCALLALTAILMPMILTRVENPWVGLPMMIFQVITAKRLINSRLLEREYNENAGTYFYRITDDGRQIIELIKKRKGDRL